MRIGVDLDDVVVDFDLGWRQAYMDDFPLEDDPGTTIDWNDLVNHTHFDSTDEFWEWIRTRRPSFYRDLVPCPGAIAGLRKLHAQGHEIVYLTGRPAGNEAHTHDWLAEFGVAFGPVHFTHVKSQVPCDVYVDDAPKYLLELRRNVSADVIRFLRPWNEYLTTEYLWDSAAGCGTVASWSELLDVLDECDPVSVTQPLPDDGRVEAKADQMIAGAVAGLRSIAEERVTNPVTGGEKGKKLARHDLVPPRPLTLVAERYGLGALKYADRNWERGYDWSLSFASLQRHALDFWSGEDYDPEWCEAADPDGVGAGTHTHGPTCSLHLTAVVFHALALMHFGETHPELDDRPTTRKG